MRERQHIQKKIAIEPHTIYLSEDEILSSFYPNEINNIEDYILYSKRIKPYIMKLAKKLTENNLSIIMDFPGNTIKQREWFKTLIEACQVEGKLIYLKVADEVCIKQILKRRQEEPARHKFDNEEIFYRIIKYFEEPSDKEGLGLEIIEKESF
ncbi:ATP-binding protein [Mycoplasmatota bacterium]|nr:ATP-binding protein [Mycoplasmatota bacterium]